MKFALEVESLFAMTNMNIPRNHKMLGARSTARWKAIGIFALTMLIFLCCCDPASAADVSDDAGVEKETMLSLIQKGGTIMYPLALGSIIAFALGLERFISLRKQRILPAGFIAGLQQAWNADPTGQNAIRYCDEFGGASGHIFKAGIRRAKMGPEVVEKTIEDVGSREADKMKRSLRPLSIIATVSPLLGLLGTVYGMIDAFQKTSASGGTAKTSMLATGIYEALVTTAAGLTIAIPVLLLYQFLLGRVDNMIDEIDEAGTDFVLAFAEAHYDAQPAQQAPATPAVPRAEPALQPVANPDFSSNPKPQPPTPPATPQTPAGSKSKAAPPQPPPPPPPRPASKAGT